MERQETRATRHLQQSTLRWPSDARSTLALLLVVVVIILLIGR
jgi:hypothetical protein